MSDVTRILSRNESGDPSAAEQLLRLAYDELRKLAVAKLADKDAKVAELVKLRYFAGLTNQQSADILGISPRTTSHSWAYAKA